MKSKQLLLTCLLAVFVSIQAHAYDYDFTRDGFYYLVTSSNQKTVEVTHGDDMGDINIPFEVTYMGSDYKVTSIGDKAFYGCRSASAVGIPYTVTHISSNAFVGIPYLNHIFVEDNNPKYDSRNNCRAIIETATNTLIVGCQSTIIPEDVTCIGDSAFNSCYNLTSINIPNSVTSIGDYAFESCDYLTSVTIGNSVTNIGDYAFKFCANLTSLTIPNSVTSIGDYAFYACSGLTSVTIGNGVTSIGEAAFQYCRGLTSVTIPESVTSIGGYAFSSCLGLTSVTIPNSVTSIGKGAFEACKDLTSIDVETGNTTFDSRNNCNAIINTATNTLIAGCMNTLIPNSVTSIGDYAFSVCSGLTSVTIPNSVTSIGDYAFYACSGLTSIAIPNSVTEIGNEAFRGCSGLTSVTIPNSVTSIGLRAFYGTGWYNAQPEGILYLDDWVIGFKGTNPIGNITINSGTKGIAGSAFKGCSGLTSIDIPNSVTSIGDNAFYGCSGLTSIDIPNSVTSIGDYAFQYCSGLTEITIPESVTSIGDYAFQYCSGLTSVTIGNGVTSIGEYAFGICSGLTEVTIGSSVTSIGNRAFAHCSGLTHITIPNNVTSIGCKAFDGCSNLTSVTMPASVITFDGNEGNAFGLSNNIEAVYISDLTAWLNTSFPMANNPLRCGARLYLNNVEVKDLVIPDGTTAILTAAFEGCESLTSVTIPNSVTNIDGWAFASCSNLTTVTIAESVTSIGDCVFKSCYSLTDVWCYAVNIPGTADEVFTNTPIGDATLHVPSASLQAYSTTAPWSGFGNIVAISNDNREEQTLSLTALPAMTYGDAAYALPQQTTQGLALTWTVANTTIASINGYLLTPLKVGTTTVTATQAGNNNYLPFTKTFTLTVNEKQVQPGVEVTDISQLDNVIYIDRIEARAGETVILSVKMKNSFVAESFGFDLVLPDGITVVVDEYGDPIAELSTERTNNKITDHFDAAFKLDGTLNIQAYSSKGRTISGNDGEVALITIKVSEGLEAGEYPIILKNIAITDESSTTVTVETVTCVLEVPAYIIGDANNDGNVNVGDLTAISHYILERPDASFLFQAADANQDGNVNVGDLTAVSHLILWGSIVRPQQAAPKRVLKPEIPQVLDPQ